MSTADLPRMADVARTQLHELVAIVKQVFTQLGYGEAEEVLELQAALQQRYLAVSASLRTTLTQCFLLIAAAEEADRHAAAGTPDAAMLDVAEAPALAARCAELQAELGLKNELVKQLIDQLRQMLESMCMWESHKHQLERHRVAEGY